MKLVLARSRKRLAQWQALKTRVRESLPALVAVLAEDFGVRKVVLFGSIAAPSGSLPEQPDIDLLVEGLDPLRYGEALARLFLLAPLPVDLVPAETGRSEVVRRALEDGEILYER